METTPSARPGLLGVIASPRTYENMIYLLWSFPVGIFYFVLIVTGLSLGIGLTPIFIGLPILLGILLAARGILAFESRLAARMLQISPQAHTAAEPPARGLWKRLSREAGSPEAWYGIFFALFKFIMSTITFILMTAFLLMSLALIASPLLALLIEQYGWDGTYRNWLSYLAPGHGLTLVEEGLINMGAGIPLLFISLHLVNAMARFHAYLALSLRGASRSGK